MRYKMAYCGTELVEYYSQVAYDQLTYLLSRGTLQSFVEGTLIYHAERIVDAYVGRREGTLRHFNPHGTVLMTLDGGGKSILFMPPKYVPLISPMYSVSIDGTSITPVGDIKVYDQYVQMKNRYFTEGLQNVLMVGSYGYVAVPYDVESITAQLCSNVLLDMVRRYSSRDVATTSPGQTNFNTMFASPAIFSSPRVFTDEMRQRLETYRVRWVDMG